jgi:hypothetical protein
MKQLLKKIKEIARNNPNGFTIQLPECTAVNSGWVVGMNETQDSFGDEGLKKVVETALKTTYLLGGWKEKRLFYFDAVYIIENKEEAINLAKLNGQLAIFSLDHSEVLFIY